MLINENFTHKVGPFWLNKLGKSNSYTPTLWCESAVPLKLFLSDTARDGLILGRAHFPPPPENRTVLRISSAKEFLHNSMQKFGLKVRRVAVKSAMGWSKEKREKLPVCCFCSTSLFGIWTILAFHFRCKCFGTILCDEAALKSCWMEKEKVALYRIAQEKHKSVFPVESCFNT